MPAKIAIVCSSFYKEISEALYQEALKELIAAFPDTKPDVYKIKGAGEIPLCVKWLLESPKKYDGILAIGTVIRGETTHYDFLCQFLERALWDLQKEYSLPVIFSILTVENKEQALKRVFKGRDHAKALIEMIRFKGQC